LNTIFAPDIPTARYLKIFTEIGLSQAEIPYNIVRMKDLVPELEKAYRSLWVILNFFSDQIFLPKEKNLYLEKVFSRLKEELSTRMVGLGIFPDQPTIADPKDRPS